MANLGTLTIDLVARTAGFVQGLDAAGRESQKLRRRIQKDFEVIGRAAGIGIASASTALVALTKSTVDAAQEIQRLSNLSQTSASDFQRFAAGADRVGISNEKLADILKDVNDRVGDFLQTGGGPLADFFENIAPKVGVTAEQFRNLSGPQSLGLFVDSLQRAGVSGNEFTFFLESLASDATALTPLLINNGELLKEFGDQAERAGAILDESLIESSLQLAESQRDLQRLFKGFTNDVASEFIPAVSGIVEAFGFAKESGQGFEGVGQAVSAVLIKISQAAVLTAGTFDILGKGLGTAAAAFGALGRQGDEGFFSTEGFKRVRDVLREANTDINNTREFYSLLLSDIQAVGESNAFEGLTDSAASADEKLRLLEKTLKETLDRDGSAIRGSVDALKEIEVTATRIDDTFIKWLDRQDEYRSLVLDLRTEEERTNDTLRERLAIIDAADEKLFGGDKAEQRRRAAEAAFGDIQAPNVAGLDAVVGGPTSEIQRLNTAQEAVNEWYEEQLDRLASFRESQSELNAVWNQKEVELAEERNRRIAQIDQARQLASLVAAEQGFGALADLTRQFAGEQSGIYKALFAVEKGAAIARSIIAIQTAIAQASASGPFPANLAAMASVASATAGLISTIASTTIQGQAHDGLMSVPKTGTYLLERGERVTTAETSAKLDKQLDSMASGNIRIVNSVDPGFIGDYMGSSPGEKVIMNVIRRNTATIKALSSA